MPIPRDEAQILRSLSILAVDLALDGLTTEGYTSLVEGFGRVKALNERGAPWGEALVGEYRRTLDEYACLYQVARE